MIIKEAKYKKVKKLVSQLVTDTVYGCDECKKEIKDYPNESQSLELTVFRNNDLPTEHLHLCSWACVFKHIPKIKSDYFVSLPYLYFDDAVSKRGYKEMIRLIKKIKQ